MRFISGLMAVLGAFLATALGEPPRGCGCPDGNAALPTTYIYRLDGSTTTPTRPWRVWFPDGLFCVQLTGAIDLPVGSHPNVFARFLAGGINVEASGAAPGVITADWSPGPSGSSLAYVFIHVYGEACPLALCLDSGMSECCVLPSGSCPGGLSLTAQPLSGQNCDGNQFDDRVDFLLGDFTDVNSNTIADQCEGHLVPASLGFPFTTLGKSPIGSGPQGHVTIAAGKDPMNGGLDVDAAGFDSFGFGLQAFIMDEDASEIAVASRGIVSGEPDQLRGQLRLARSSGNEFDAFADYSEIGAASIVVRLLDGAGGQLKTAQLTGGTIEPLVRIESLPSEIKMDAIVRIANLAPRRAISLRFATPITALVLDEFSIPTKQVAEVQFLASSEDSLGALNRITIVATGAFEIVTLTHMFAERFGFDWSGTRGAVITTDTGSGSTCLEDSLALAAGLTCVTGKPIYASSRVWVDIDEPPSPLSLQDGDRIGVIFCGKPSDPPNDEEVDVDPLDFPVREVAGVNMVDIEIPFCLIASSTEPAPCTSFPNPDPVFRIDYMFNHDYGQTPPTQWGCTIPGCSAHSFLTPLSAGNGVIGRANIFPVRITEEIDPVTHVPCMLYEFDSPSQSLSVDFSACQPCGVCPPCSATGLSSMAIRIVPPAGSRQYSSLSAIKIKYSLAEPIKMGGAGSQSIAARLGDHNHDGVVNSQDLFDFLTGFFSADPTADINADGAINSQDFFDFVNCLFLGC